MKIDLHLHTNYSDGRNTIKEVVDKAIQEKIELISITDHDSIAGEKQAIEYCQGKIKFISGIEFTCMEEFLIEDDFSYSVHLLGYGIEIDNLTLKQQLEQREKEVFKLYEALIDSLSEFQIFFKYQDVPIECGIVMQLSDICSYLENNYRNHPYLKEAKQRVLSYAAKFTKINFSIKTAIELIHEAKGTAILAHPFYVYHQFKKVRLSHEKVIKMIDKVQQLGIDGIEAMYLDFSEEERKFLWNLAKEKQLKSTVGSDYHGSPARNSMINFETLIPCIL